MKVSRRGFIHAVGSSAAAAAVLGTVGNVLGQRIEGTARMPIESTLDPLNYLTAEHFSPFVGTTMRAGAGRLRTVSLLLIDLKDLTYKTNVERGYTGESFSLLFEGPSGLSGELYTFRHGSLGTFSLFLSPVGNRGTRYEAVVSRITQ